MALVLWLLAAAAAFGYGTLWLGWWVVPVLGLALGRLIPRRFRPVMVVPAAAALGWGLLLVRATLVPAFGALEHRLSALLPASSAALIGATLAFPALLAWGAALLAQIGRDPA